MDKILWKCIKVVCKIIINNRRSGFNMLILNSVVGEMSINVI